MQADHGSGNGGTRSTPPASSRAPRQPGLDELRLLAKVARLYHEHGFRQPAIAEQLGLSQARVSRMLRQAEALGVVRTVVTMPPGVHGELEDQVQARYGLRDVIVVEPDEDEGDLTVALGSAAAKYLDATLIRGHVVGITSWSEAVLAAVQLTTRKTVPAVERVVQLLGGVGVPSGQVHANRLVGQFADCFGANPVLLPAPGLVTDPLVKEALLRDESITTVMAAWGQVTDAVVGIGGIEPSPLFLRSRSGVTEPERNKLQALRAVGDICFRFFDAAGQLVESDLDQRVMGIGAAEFLRIPRRIGIAGGRRKFEAIRAAAAGHWINVLITDLQTARRLVSEPPGPG